MSWPPTITSGLWEKARRGCGPVKRAVNLVSFTSRASTDTGSPTAALHNTPLSVLVSFQRAGAVLIFFFFFKNFFFLFYFLRRKKVDWSSTEIECWLPWSSFQTPESCPFLTFLKLLDGNFVAHLYDLSVTMEKKPPPAILFLFKFFT